jgi:4-amino-4-deoxy-L-arabinose transferase-like glycosyltransferase
MNLSIRKILDRPAGVFFFFALLSVALRFFSFFPSVMNHDESTYLEIAREMLDGKRLYVDLIDIKPPGIFIIYAVFQWIFGHSIFIMRLLAALWIALTSFMIFKTSLQLISNRKAALASGVIYILFVSTWSGFGISPDIEIFFNLLTISALYVLFKRDHWLNYLGAGLLMGMGFIIKYVVLFDFCAFLFFFIWKFVRDPSPKSAGPLFRKLSLFMAGFIVPFLCVNLWYFWTGHFAEFARINYGAVARYPKEFIPEHMAGFVLGFILYFFPVLFLFAHALFSRSLHASIGKELPHLSILWVILVFIAILLPGNTFNHYWIQLMLPVSLLAGAFFHPANRIPASINWMTRGVAGRIILFMLCVIIISFSVRDHWGKPDTPRQIAGYLKSRLHTPDVFYAANHFHILYFLLQKDCPTPYVHPSLLTSPSHRQALRIDLQRELKRINDKKPAYIFIQEKGRNQVDWLYPLLNEHYVIEKVFSRNMLLYRRIDRPAETNP